MFIQALACLATQHTFLKRYAAQGYELERPILDCELTFDIIAPRPHSQVLRVWVNEAEVRRIR